MLRPIIRVLLAVGLLSALALAFFEWRFPRPAPIATPTPWPTKWTYRTEQEWIVGQVVKSIAGMAHYAQSGAALAPESLDIKVDTETNPAEATAFKVRIPGRGQAVRLAVAEYIWSPATYAALATDLLGPAAASNEPTPKLEESPTFGALTRPRTDVMVAESKRVSSALAAHMTDVAAHEDAALLFATLGLREWSGNFYDNHRTLCRLASHLAMAAALRRGSEPGPSARVAEATLLTLAFRDQKGALALLDTLGRAAPLSPAAAAWSRTLRMRNTEDWRVLADPNRATLLERREYLVWLNFKHGVNHSLEFIEQTDRDGLSDWGSIVLSGDYSVATGRRFVPQGLSEVLAEANATPLDLGGSAEPTRIVRALNEEPASGPVRWREGRTTVEVIDSGTWAAFIQRHLLMHVERGVDCMLRMWGLKEAGTEYRTQMERAFGGLRQFPLAAVRMATDRVAYRAAMRASVDLLIVGPEWVGGHNWNSLLTPPEFRAEVSTVPPLESWCHPLFPAGTYFEWPKRLRRPDGHLRVRGPALQEMHDRLPYYSLIAEAAADERFGDKATPDDLRAAYGPLLDYDVRLMTRVANAAKDDPAEYKRIYRRIGELDPDRLRHLADYLVEKGEKEEAAATYEQYVAQARDRVGVCASVGWLVDYDEEHGKRKRALELAKEAAEIYCYGGLLTLAELYEGRGQWARAEEYYLRLADRYDEERLILAYDLRYQRATRDERHRARREGLLSKYFPKGLEAHGADPLAPPEDGVLLTGISAEATKATLRRGDVIVALNGFRVRTYDQYRVIRSLSRAPSMDLVVWRSQYLHIGASNPGRWFGVQVQSYKGPEDPEQKYL